jgi:hypothetical protein
MKIGNDGGNRKSMRELGELTWADFGWFMSVAAFCP